MFSHRTCTYGLSAVADFGEKATDVDFREGKAGPCPSESEHFRSVRGKQGTVTKFAAAEMKALYIVRSCGYSGEYRRTQMSVRRILTYLPKQCAARAPADQTDSQADRLLIRLRVTQTGLRCRCDVP